MFPRTILGISTIEDAAPAAVAAAVEQDLCAQLQAMVDSLRCPACGSLNYETTLFVFSARVEKWIECRACSSVVRDPHDDRSHPLHFLVDALAPLRATSYSDD